MRPCCGRRWRRRPSSRPTSTTCSTPACRSDPARQPDRQADRRHPRLARRIPTGTTRASRSRTSTATTNIRGNCHVVPNHALMIMALLYAPHDFQKAQMIVNTSGWDTDCNAGNVGCLLGIMNGLDGLDDGPDWRGPIADRLLISSADGGNSINDAVRTAYYLTQLSACNSPVPAACTAPKSGAQFHFSLPGSVQGFRPQMAPRPERRSSSSAMPSSRAAACSRSLRALGPGQVAAAVTRRPSRRARCSTCGPMT